MKKITKLGLSALCGSLATISVANAGSIDVTGSAHLTWTSLGGETTGNPAGMKSNLSFIGSGELDGGQTFALTIAHTDQSTFSASEIALTTNNIGKLTLSNGNGGGLGSYDDTMPTAWEESWDTGLAAAPDKIGGVGSTMHLNWISPTVGEKGTKLVLAYTPQNDGSTPTDKTSGGGSHLGKGFDAVLDLRPEAKLNLILGYSVTEQPHPENSNELNGNYRFHGNKEEALVALKYKLGPFSLGGQYSAEDLKTTRYEGQAEAADYYINNAWGIALNINDGLSVSYGEHRSNKVFTQANTGGTSREPQNKWTPKSKQQVKSTQVGYTIGGVTLKYADSSSTNHGYSEGKDRRGQTLSIGIAF